MIKTVLAAVRKTQLPNMQSIIALGLPGHEHRTHELHWKLRLIFDLKSVTSAGAHRGVQCQDRVHRVGDRRSGCTRTNRINNAVAFDQFAILPAIDLVLKILNIFLRARSKKAVGLDHRLTGGMKACRISLGFGGDLKQKLNKLDIIALIHTTRANRPFNRINLPKSTPF